MIKLIVKDLNYSLDEREKYLKTISDFSSGKVLLNTCNRVELYSGQGKISPKIMKHLFRVTAGLESALLGEKAIQGQVKTAYFKANQFSSLSKEMHWLFQNALRVGKRVRNETKISEGAMSHSLAVIEILKQDNINLQNAKILMMGINNLNIEAIKYLIKKGSKTIFIANRTYAKAKALSKEHGCQAIQYPKFFDELKNADIIISATSAPHYILKKENYTVTKKQYIFDLAVPRDIDPEIGLLKNVKLFNIEKIEKRVLNNKLNRSKIINEAEKIIEEEIKKYYARA